jgi:hypothetical protein
MKKYILPILLIALLMTASVPGYCGTMDTVIEDGITVFTVVGTLIGVGYTVYAVYNALPHSILSPTGLIIMGVIVVSVVVIGTAIYILS